MEWLAFIQARLAERSTAAGIGAAVAAAIQAAAGGAGWKLACSQLAVGLLLILLPTAGKDTNASTSESGGGGPVGS
jgi:hypothetical protein